MRIHNQHRCFEPSELLNCFGLFLHFFVVDFFCQEAIIHPLRPDSMESPFEELPTVSAEGTNSLNRIPLLKRIVDLYRKKLEEVRARFEKRGETLPPGISWEGILQLELLSIPERFDRVTSVPAFASPDHQIVLIGQRCVRDELKITAEMLSQVDEAQGSTPFQIVEPMRTMVAPSAIASR